MIRRILALALLVVLAAPASAQSLWLDREHRPSVLAEIQFPSFDGADSHFPTWIWFVSTRLPIGGHSAFVAELPYARGEFGAGSFTTSQSSIGNPYLGIEYRPKPTGLLLEAGARLPLASDTKEIPFVMGYFSDVTRQEAFVPDQVPVRIGLHYHHAPAAESRLAYDLRVVPTVWIKTDDTFLDESELFLGYGAWLGYEGEDARIRGGISGTWNATSDGADFGEASLHQLDLEADFLRGQVRPGVQLRLPLDDGLQSVLDTVFGVSVTVLP